MEDVSAELLAAGRGYEALFVPALFAPWTGHVVKAAGVGEGHAVLDVACGSGVLARACRSAAGPSGSVAGVDPAPGMLAAAHEVDPTIDWRLGAAEELPFDDASFDRVVSQFGMMFFEDRAKALAEMQRVLKPGGALAIAVWDHVEENPGYEGVIAVLREEVSDEAANILTAPFRLGDGAAVAAEIEKAGFDRVHIQTLGGEARFPSSRVMLEADLRGWLPMFDINLSEEKIADVLEASDALLGKYVEASGEAVFPTSAHIISAVR